MKVFTISYGGTFSIKIVSYIWYINVQVWPVRNLPVGCRVATGALHYYARSPVSS